MSYTSEVFLEQCAQQGVELSCTIDTAINKLWIENKENRDVGEKTPLLLGVIAAATSLEQNTKLPLANKPIDAAPLGEDIPSRILAGLINKSLEITQEERPAFNVRPPVKRKDGVCYDFEKKWDRTFDTLQQTDTSRAPLMQIFTQNYEPVVVRKGRGRPTALLLQPAALGKSAVVYPAGSAVQLSTRMDTYIDSPYALGGRKLRMSAREVEILPVSSIRSMSFQRLTAHQLVLEQRAEHFPNTSTDIRPLKDIQALIRATLERPDTVSIQDISFAAYAWQGIKGLLT